MRRTFLFAVCVLSSLAAFVKCTSGTDGGQDAATDGTVDSPSTLDSGKDVAVVDAAPEAEAGVSVKIVQPANDASFDSGDQVQLVANATDSHGNALTDQQHLAWSTNASVDPIGEGSPASFQLIADAGSYFIRATATDDAGNSAFDQVGINVR